MTVRVTRLSLVFAAVALAATGGWGRPLAAPSTGSNAALATLLDLPDPSIPATPLAVRAGRRAIPVERARGVRYARVPVAGPTVIEITSPAPIQNWVVVPSRLGIQPTVRGRVMRFTLQGVRDVAVQIDTHEPLYLFADAPLPAPPARPRTRRGARTEPAPRPSGRSVLEFGADPTGRRLATTALQEAINAVAGTRDTLRVPAGTFRTGSLVIRGAMTLLLAPGARLQGSEQPADYPVEARATEPDLRRALDGHARDGSRLSHSQLLLIDGASDVTIAGRGTIDGAGTALRREGKPATLLRIRDARRVRVEDVVLRNPAAWNSHVLRSEDVVFRRVRLLGDREALNNDGIDPDASRRVTIEQCFIDTGDDAVAVKSTRHGGRAGEVEDVTVRGCVLRTRKSAMKIGTESRCAAIRRVTFAGNDVLEADRALSLYCRDGARFEQIEFADNRIEGWTPGGTAQLIDAEVRRRDGMMGSIRDLRVRGCWAFEPAPVASSLRGLDATHAIDGVRFEGVVLGGRVCVGPGDVPLRTNEFVRGVTFVADPSR